MSTHHTASLHPTSTEAAPSTQASQQTERGSRTARCKAYLGFGGACVSGTAGDRFNLNGTLASLIDAQAYIAKCSDDGQLAPMSQNSPLWIDESYLYRFDDFKV